MQCTSLKSFKNKCSFNSQQFNSLHCGVEYFAQLSAAVKIDLELEIQSLPKCPFLNVFSNIYGLTKVDVLGNWEVNIFFRNLWRLFFVFYRGTLN